MNGIATVMKKEFARFFGDRRMILMTLLPAILIYVVYTFMGTALQDVFAPDDDHTAIAVAVNFSSSVGQAMLDTNANITVLNIEMGDVESAKAAISSREPFSAGDSLQPAIPDLLLIFPYDFDGQV